MAKKRRGTSVGPSTIPADCNTIRDIVVSDLGMTPDAIDYLFAEIEPSEITGFVWQDFNNDGLIDFGEQRSRTSPSG